MIEGSGLGGVVGLGAGLGAGGAGVGLGEAGGASFEDLPNKEPNKLLMAPNIFPSMVRGLIKGEL
jgi:hypothetical protein